MSSKVLTKIESKNEETKTNPKKEEEKESQEELVQKEKSVENKEKETKEEKETQKEEEEEEKEEERKEEKENEQEKPDQLTKILKKYFTKENVNTKFKQLELIKKEKERITKNDQEFYRSALHWLCKNPLTKELTSLRPFKYLISIGADLNILDDTEEKEYGYSETPLMSLCQKIHLNKIRKKAVYYLIKQGSNPFLCGKNQQNSLFFLGVYFRLHVVKKLLALHLNSLLVIEKERKKEKKEISLPLWVYSQLKKKNVNKLKRELQGNFNNLKSKYGTTKMVEPISQANILHIICLFSEDTLIDLEIIQKVLTENKISVNTPMTCRLYPIHLINLNSIFYSKKKKIFGNINKNNKNANNNNSKNNNNNNNNNNNKKNNNNNKNTNNNNKSSNNNNNQNTNTNNKNINQNINSNNNNINPKEKKKEIIKYILGFIKLLLLNGQDICQTNLYDISPYFFQLCSKKPNLKILKFFIDNGAQYKTIFDDQSTSIHYLCLRHKPKIKVIEYLLSKGIDINVQNYKQLTALHYLCHQEPCPINVVKYFISKGAAINTKDQFRQNILHFLAKKKNPPNKVIKILCESNIDINSKDFNQKSVLHILCNRNNVDLNTVKLLIDYGAEMMSINQIKNTPFHLLCYYNATNYRVIKYFIKKDSNFLNQKNMRKETPLHLFFQNKTNPASLKVLKYLTKYNGDLHALDRDGTSPFYHYCKGDKLDLEIIQFLIQQKVNINLSNKNDKKTALHLICQKKQKTNPKKRQERNALYFQIVKILIENNCKINCTDNTNSTPLIYLCQKENPQIEIIELLLKKGAKINCQNSDDKSPFFLACEQKNPSIKLLKLLIKRGADINIQVENLTTPIHLICNRSTGLPNIVKLLIKYGVHINSRIAIKKYTPLHYVCKTSADPAIIKLLLINGTEPNFQCQLFKNTAFNFLVMYNKKINDQTIDLFFEYSYDINLRNNQGKTLLDLAEEYKRESLITRLNKSISNQNSPKKKVISNIGQVFAHLNQDLSNFQKINSDDIQIIKQVGRGSFKDVYEGRWNENRVAVSKFFNSKNFSQNQLEEIISEVKMMCRLSHPCIVKFYGACIDDPVNIMLVGQFCARGSLLYYLKQTQISKKRKIKIALDLAHGIQYLHSLNLVHRDLKSPNILIDQNFNAKITDFGLTKTINLHQSQNLNTIVGTMNWMAPELLRDERDYTNKIDIYAFGIILWEISTQRMPFKNMSPLRIPMLVGYKGHRPEIKKTDLFYDIIIKCWAHDPNERDDIKQIIERLKKC
ncbi:ankyrin repeat-containing protein [Anaeramoeba flamelloides]|uniref:Ankyrin repeat-containing protein n=1 Tax=Anaeramoeba flamelloides TaxID=1746091 RepID=A0AAV7ZUU0_9EUKA|nr:ankyrin repeat-containing protein [Anaeramoeba flamelloides]